VIASGFSSPWSEDVHCKSENPFPVNLLTVMVSAPAALQKLPTKGKKQKRPAKLSRRTNTDTVSETPGCHCAHACIAMWQ
jgi:hypothetical protein